MRLNVIFDVIYYDVSNLFVKNCQGLLMQFEIHFGDHNVPFIRPVYNSIKM